MQGKTLKQVQPQMILVVDDEKNIRSLMQRVLEKNGYQVVTVSSGEEALAYLTKGQHVDLIVLDVNLPQISGRRLIEAILQKRPTVKILLTSGITCEADIKKIAKQEHILFLQKPYDNKTLLRNVHNCLQ